MKNACIVFLLPLVVSLSDCARGGQLLYLASQGEKTITAYEIDARSGALTKRFDAGLPGNPGPLAFSPDRKFVYAAMTGLDGQQAGVATLARASDGTLTLKQTAPITSRSPYIRTSNQGRNLLAAHYGAGDVTVYQIDGGLCTGELLDHKVTQRTAHCIETDPSGEFVFVPHTSPNRVYQFRLDKTTGKLSPNDPPYVKGPDEGHRYHQPRHYVHHPTLQRGYTSNERGGGITAWRFDPQQGTLTEMQTLSTLPPGFEGRSAAADIHITPDGRFAYVSNRDLTEREDGEAMQDTLAGFSLDPQTGEMSPIGHFPTAYFPRTFCIDLDGRFVYSAGQRSSTLFAYRIDGESGELEHFATYQTRDVPIWVMCGRAGRQE